MGSGLVVPDLSAGQHDGVMTGMDAETDWVAGQDGYALNISGATHEVRATGVPTLTGNWTFVITCRLPLTASDFSMIFQRNPTAAPNWPGPFDFRADARSNPAPVTCLYGSVAANKLYSVATDAANHLTLGEWATFAVTYDDAVGATLYRDGLFVAFNRFHASQDDGEPVRLGMRADGVTGDIEIAQASICDRALSADEVSWLYAEPHAPIWTPNPVWYFDTGAVAFRPRPFTQHRHGPRLVTGG